MNPWLVAFVMLALGAVLGALATIAVRRKAGQGAGGIVAPAPDLAALEAKADEARTDAAAALHAAGEDDNVEPAEWINQWNAGHGAGPDGGKPGGG